MKLFHSRMLFPSILTVLFAAASVAEQKGKLLSRSIYVPIIFSIPADIAPSLHMWIGDEGTERPVQRHTFLFTFFPDKGTHFYPEQVEVRLKAEGVCEGSGIDTNFVVSPHGIAAGTSFLHFDEKEMIRQVRARKRDVRMSPKIVRVRCRSTEALAAETDEDGEGEIR
jgi:hypothetical protein